MNVKDTLWLGRAVHPVYQRVHPIPPLDPLIQPLCSLSSSSRFVTKLSLSLSDALFGLVLVSFRVNVNGARRVIHRSNTYSCPRLVHPPKIATKTGRLSCSGGAGRMKPWNETAATASGTEKPERRKMHFHQEGRGMIGAVLSIACGRMRLPLSFSPNRESNRFPGVVFGLRRCKDSFVVAAHATSPNCVA